MQDIEKQIAGLKKHLRESKEQNKRFSEFFFSVYCFCEGLETQNVYLKGMAKRFNNDCLEAKAAQNKYLIQELKELLKKYEN